MLVSRHNESKILVDENRENVVQLQAPHVVGILIVDPSIAKDSKNTSLLIHKECHALTKVPCCDHCMNLKFHVLKEEKRTCRCCGMNPYCHRNKAIPLLIDEKIRVVRRCCSRGAI